MKEFLLFIGFCVLVFWLLSKIGGGGGGSWLGDDVGGME